MGNFYVSDHDDGAVAFVVAGGEIDYHVSPTLEESLARQATCYLVLDLSAVTFLDSTAIRVMQHAYWKLHEAGGALALVCDHEDDDPVFKILEITGLVNFLPVYRSREGAIRGIGAGAALAAPTP